MEELFASLILLVSGSTVVLVGLVIAIVVLMMASNIRR